MAAINSHGSHGSLLRLGGVDCGFVAAMGGGAYGEVVEEPPGADDVVGKHLGAVRYEDIALTCTDPPGAALANWIAQTFSGSQTGHDGEIVDIDLNGTERSRLSFRNGVITAITVPSLDANSRNALQLGLRLAPEWTSRDAGSGAKVKSASGKQKAWQSNSFRLTIGGLDCTKVSQVEQLVARRAFTADAVADARASQRPLSPLEIPDLVVTLSEASAAGWFAWHQDFVVMGRGTEKNGTLELLAPDLKTTLATLSLGGLGIYRLAENTLTSGRQVIPRVQATMYCERLSLMVAGATGSSSAAGSPSPGAAPPAGAAPPSRADVIAPLGGSLSPQVTARRDLLGQLRAR